MELAFIFNRKLLRKNSVSIDNFVRFASQFQKAIYDLGEAQNPQVKKKIYTLLIKDQKKGSQVFVMIPQYQTTSFGTSPIDEVMQNFSQISNLIDRDRDGSNYNEAKAYFNDLEIRRTFLKRIKSLSRYPGSFAIELKKTHDSEPIRIFKAKKNYRKTLNKWRRMDIEKRIEQITGALTIIHGERDLYIRIRDIFGNSIEYKYDEKEEPRFLNMYKKVIKVKGLYNPIRNQLEKIEMLNVINILPIEDVRGIRFTRTLNLKLEFKYDAFFAKNEELNIVAAGKTFSEMYNDLYNCIISHIRYFIVNDDLLTKGAQKIKYKLLNLINEKDLKEIKDGYNKKT